jgi:hypothetical protein
VPFSCTRTRKLSRPRITGRLDPGEKVDAAMPGLSNSRLPIEPPLPSAPPFSRSICSPVIVVTAEKLSSSRSDKFSDGAAVAGPAGAATGLRLTIGLATTEISGSVVLLAPCAAA